MTTAAAEQAPPATLERARSDAALRRFEPIQAAHRELMAEYMRILGELSAAERKGETPRAKRFVHDHIRQKLEDLQVAYTYYAQYVAEDDEKRQWVERTIRSVQQLLPLFYSRRVGATLATVAGKAWTFIIFASGLFAFLIEKHWDEGKIETRVETLVQGFVWTDLLRFVSYLFLVGGYLVGLLIWLYVSGFYDKRALFLGRANDYVAFRKKRAKKRRGKNIYNLENRLFRHLDVGKRREEQKDVSLFGWIAIVNFFFFVALWFLGAPAYILIAAVLPGALAFVADRRASQRHWV